MRRVRDPLFTTSGAWPLRPTVSTDKKNQAGLTSVPPDQAASQPRGGEAVAAALDSSAAGRAN